MFNNIFKTKSSALVQAGRELAIRVDEIAAGLQTKSHEHTALLWEADILRAKADDIERKCGVIPNLRTSVLLRNSGHGVLRTYSELVDECRAFHAAYDEQAQLK